MKFSLSIFLSTICIPFQLQCADKSAALSQVPDFSSILYDSISANENSASAALSEAPPLRPLPEITSHLLADPSLLTTYDAEGNSLLSYLIKNTSRRSVNGIGSLISFIALNNPHHFVMTTQEAAGRNDHKTLRKTVEWAANKGHHDLTFNLLHRCPDILATALDGAAYGGQQELIAALLDTSGPTGNQVTSSMIEEALYNAAQGGHQATVDCLIACYGQHKHPLSEEVIKKAVGWAAKKGHQNLTFYFLHRCPDILATALKSAAYGGQLELVTALLDDQGPTGNQVNPSMVEEALYQAAAGGYQAIVDCLIAWHEQHNHPLSDKVIEETVEWAANKGHQNLTFYLTGRYPHTLANALKPAAYGGQLELVTALLDDQGPTGNQVNPSMVEDALYQAAAGGYQAIVDCLIAWHEQHNHPLSDKVIEETVEWAANKGHQNLTFYFLHRCPDILATALKSAAYGGQHELVTALLDEQGPTGQYIIPEMIEEALYEAAAGGYQTIADCLIAWHEQHNHPVSNQVIEEAVGWASNKGYKNLTFYLTGRYPHTLANALRRAAQGGHQDLITALLDEQGPTGNQVNPSMVEDALYNAAANGYQTIVDCLIAWHEQHNHPVSNQVIEETVEWAAHYDHQELTFNLLNRYPHTLATALQSAALANRTELTKRLLEFEPAYVVPILPHITQEIRQAMRTVTVSDSLFLLLTWRDQENNLINREHLKSIITDYVRWQNEPALIDILQCTPELGDYTFKTAARLAETSIISYLLTASFLNLSYSVVESTFTDLIGRGKFENLDDFLTWKSHDEKMIRPELIQNAFFSAVEHNNLPILKNLLKRYSFAGNKIRKMILLKKLPALPVDLIFQHYTHPEREIKPEHLLTAFHTAVEMKHFDIGKLLFSHLARFNKRPLCKEDALTTIRNAAFMGNKDCVLYLLSFYPDLSKDALYRAAQRGHQTLTDSLIAWHVQHTHPLSNEVIEQTVKWAANKGHHELTFHLLQRYPNTLEDALRSAAYGGQQALIQSLLDEQGPTSNQVTPSMIDEALYQAAAGGHQTILDNLILWYEQHSHVLSNEALNNTVGWAAQKGHHALTFNLLHRYPHTLARALMSAAYGGHQALIQALLEEQGPTGNQVTPTMIEEALPKAAAGGHQAIIDQLIAWCAPHTHSLSNEVIEETVGWAAYKGHHDLTFSLLQRYPDTLTRALLSAAYGGKQALIQALLNEQEPTGNQITPTMIEQALYNAADSGYQTIVDCLIAWCKQHNHALSPTVQKEIVKLTTENGHTDLTLNLLQQFPQALTKALTYGAYTGHLILIKTLLNEQEPTQYHVTPKIIELSFRKAVQGEHPAIIEVLMSWCSNHNHPISDKIVKSTVEWAAKKGYRDLTFHLLHHYPHALAKSLNAASSNGQLVLMQALLDNQGPTIKQITPKMIEQALYQAAQKGHLSITNLLMSWCDQHNHALSKEVLSNTVAWASYNGHQELTFYLLHRYPDTLEEALKAASFNNQIPLLQALLDEQGPIGHQVTPCMIEQTLSYTIKSRYPRVVDYLLTWCDQHNYSLRDEIIKKIVGWAAQKAHPTIFFRLLQRYPTVLAELLKSASRERQLPLLHLLLDEQGPTGDLITPFMIEQALLVARSPLHTNVVEILTAWQNRHQPQSWAQWFCSFGRRK